MSKDAWFEHFERIDNMRMAGELDITDDEAADLADDGLRDEMASLADFFHDEAKHELG